MGTRQGHYFLVLHLSPDQSVRYKSIATQTISEDNQDAEEIPDAAAEKADSLMPFCMQRFSRTRPMHQQEYSDSWLELEMTTAIFRIM